jgi:hypothetical protein
METITLAEMNGSFTPELVVNLALNRLEFRRGEGTKVLTHTTLNIILLCIEGCINVIRYKYDGSFSEERLLQRGETMTIGRRKPYAIGIKKDAECEAATILQFGAFYLVNETTES